MEKILPDRRPEAVALAQGVAKGSIFALANPEASVQLFYEAFPQFKPTGMDEAAAEASAMRQFVALRHVFNLEQSHVTRWGESSAANYDAYVDFLVKWGVVKEKVPVSDLTTFDAAAVVAQAKAYKP
jgi:NitT/TauT family transport system substrate-binding protein